ncbi:hypothetical protein CLOBY_03810 [Clostridium saccharobutylicum]|nr:hypothetical protein CLOBY_03810 [Clostridium saccharobutylicum]NSB88327.1 hypothetical protein [Clostridium saccharobutylicum]NYC29364.1 hypothetical protein [Clostridium saccharobutylicum]OOM10893.1 hypothetical protein CLSAB_42760 [Clostridium saccharobutylicum]
MANLSRASPKRNNKLYYDNKILVVIFITDY